MGPVGFRIAALQFVDLRGPSGYFSAFFKPSREGGKAGGLEDLRHNKKPGKAEDPNLMTLRGPLSCSL